MPITYALFLCIPIGLLFYFEARWLIRYLLGRYEEKERRAARFFGVFGALLIPLIYCFGHIEDAFPGPAGRAIATGFFAAVSWGLSYPFFKTCLKESRRQ
jgi:hypothetical protein